MAELKKKPTNSDSEFSPYKTAEFEDYHLWSKLPRFLKGKDFALINERMGIEDEKVIELLKIKTQKEFAQVYGVSVDVLTDWNKYIVNLPDPFEKTRELLRKVIHNTVWATYNGSLKADPKANADRKLAMQIAGWVEKSEQKNTIEISGIADLIKRANSEYRQPGDTQVPGENKE